MLKILPGTQKFQVSTWKSTNQQPALWQSHHPLPSIQRRNHSTHTCCVDQGVPLIQKNQKHSESSQDRFR